jgi:1-deoxy-D-xylulose-5-phosphate synthase
VRTFGGISGFPKISESDYDTFGTGHASSSVSVALGFATARDLKKEKFNVVAIIGDGSMTGGLAFEGLQNAGHLKKSMLIILNDNEMFISQTVGAIAGYFAKLLTLGTIKNAQEKVIKFVSRFRGFGSPFTKFIRRVKVMLFPGMLFEELGFRYIGPVNGHNIDNLIEILSNLKDLKGPTLLHLTTKKGKGFEPAESNPAKFHGIGKFDPQTGKTEKKMEITYTNIFADTLTRLAGFNDNIVAITAAMASGTGLDKFAREFPERFFDVGIAEEHAVCFAAGLALNGMQPVCAIYSTFLQRCLDNIICDVCLQGLPVIFAIDRAGLVGEDGPTHHGIFDISYLKFIPNLIFMAPGDENELQHMLNTALTINKPCAIRYPRGTGPGVAMDMYQSVYPIGKAKLARKGKDLCFAAIGSLVHPCLEAAEILSKDGIEAMVLNMRFISPLDEQALKDAFLESKNFITAEENVLKGGFGESVKAVLAGTDAQVLSIGLPNDFIEQGDIKTLRNKYGLTAENIANAAKKMLGKERQINNCKSLDLPGEKNNKK